MGRAFYDEYVTEFNWDAVDAEGSPQFLARERVTRCRDCAHAYKDGTLCTYFSLQDDDDLSLFPSFIEPDGFCAWGKPREEE